MKRQCSGTGYNRIPHPAQTQNEKGTQTIKARLLNSVSRKYTKTTTSNKLQYTIFQLCSHSHFVQQKLFPLCPDSHFAQDQF